MITPGRPFSRLAPPPRVYNGRVLDERPNGSSMMHPNLKLAEEVWDAVARSDVAALKRYWQPEIVWHIMGDNPWHGDHVGHDAVFEYLANVGESGGAYTTRLDDVLVSEDRVLYICHVNARRHGKTVETDQLLLARLKEGRVAEVWTVPMAPTDFEGFWV